MRKPGAGDNNPRPDGSGTMDGLEFVRDMVEHGADLEARMTTRARLNNTSLNELGATPFVLAALVADADLMRTLAELGADPLTRTDDGSTALMAAAGLGTRSPGEDAGTEEEVLEAVQLALDLGADIDAVNDNGETPMHGAAYKNLPRVVHLAGRQRRRHRGLEPAEQVRLDAADDRARLPLRQLQTVPGHGRGGRDDHARAKACVRRPKRKRTPRRSTSTPSRRPSLHRTR